MPTRSPKLDVNQFAKSIVDQATGDEPKKKPATAKRLAGQKGGLKGGKTRMSMLTDELRHELALKGVAARKAKAPAGLESAGAGKVTKSGR